MVDVISHPGIVATWADLVSQSLRQLDWCLTFVDISPVAFESLSSLSFCNWCRCRCRRSLWLPMHMYVTSAIIRSSSSVSWSLIVFSGPSSHSAEVVTSLLLPNSPWLYRYSEEQTVTRSVPCRYTAIAENRLWPDCI